MISIIEKETIDFLQSLSKNNNREWFSEHRDTYTTAYNNMIGFADHLLFKMNQHDHIETPSGKQSLFRMYKDVRFSKDKTPYNTHWSGRFKRATKKLRGGYYYQIGSGCSYIACGFWAPNTVDLKKNKGRYWLEL